MTALSALPTATTTITFTITAPTHAVVETNQGNSKTYNIWEKRNFLPKRTSNSASNFELFECKQSEDKPSSVSFSNDHLTPLLYDQLIKKNKTCSKTKCENHLHSCSNSKNQHSYLDDIEEERCCGDLAMYLEKQKKHKKSREQKNRRKSCDPPQYNNRCFQLVQASCIPSVSISELINDLRNASIASSNENTSSLGRAKSNSTVFKFKSTSGVVIVNVVYSLMMMIPKTFHQYSCLLLQYENQLLLLDYLRNQHMENLLHHELLFLTQPWLEGASQKSLLPALFLSSIAFPQKVHSGGEDIDSCCCYELFFKDIKYMSKELPLKIYFCSSIQ
ncbi:hypothetical protein GQX74_010179 [Glossina fuscipes]|nr:hypothetical protein GQX74_010179 [Glossina fuscipes]